MPRPRLSWTGYAALGLALICLFLPALSLRSPVAPTRHWSLAGLLRSGAFALARHRVHAHSPARLLHNLREIRREIGRGLGARHATPVVFKLAVFIAPALYIAALATLLAILAGLWGWRLMLAGAAITGAAAAGYAAGIALWLTAAVRQDVRGVLHRAGALAPALKPWTQGLARQAALRPELGLWLLPLALLAAALSPPAEKKAKV